MHAPPAFDAEPAIADLQAAPRLAIVLGPRVALAHDAPADERAVLTALAGPETGAFATGWMRNTGLPLALLPLIGLAAARLNGPYGPDPARKRLTQLYADTAPGPVHHALAALAREHAITAVTLEWHGRLRAALAAAGAPIARIQRAGDLGTPGLVEALGSVDQRESLVISASEQLRAFGHRGEGAALLAAIFATHAVLVIGAEPIHPLLSVAASAAALSPPVFLAFGPGPTLGWRPLVAPRDRPADETAIALLRAIGAGRRPPLPPEPAAPVALRPSEWAELVDDLERIGRAVQLTPERAAASLDQTLRDVTWKALVEAVREGILGDKAGEAAVHALLNQGVLLAAPGNPSLKRWLARLAPAVRRWRDE